MPVLVLGRHRPEVPAVGECPHVPREVVAAVDLDARDPLVDVGHVGDVVPVGAAEQVLQEMAVREAVVERGEVRQPPGWLKVTSASVPPPARRGSRSQFHITSIER